MASIWDFIDSLPKRSDVTPEELARRRQGYADLYQGGLLAGNRDQMPLSVQGAQATQDFLPLIGDALALGEAGEALSRGELAAAGLLGAGAAIGLVPGAGDVLAKPVMAAGRRAADIARRIEVDPNAFGSMGGNIRLKPQAGGDVGIRAYHGSPHSFDKFSMDAIGTGEGAQVYGHGLYFAENEAVARSYRDALSLDAGFSYKGKSGLTRDQLAEAIEADYGRGYLDNVSTPRGVADSVADELIYGASNRKLGPERTALRDSLRQKIGRTDLGSMYEVNINANPEDFLDWDAPLTEQPNIARRLGYRTRSVQDIDAEAEALFQKHGFYEDMPPDAKARLEALNNELNLPPATITGEQAYSGGDELSHLHRTVAGKQFGPEDTAAMREAGIPGIKYFDAGSRGAGEGSRNYVVFDENLINIVKKYGIAGAAAMLGVSAMDVEQAMAQGAPQPQPQGLLGGAR